MRLLVVSDVHLEFGPFAFPKPMPEFDVAVFAGDMHRPIVAALDWMVDQRRAGPLLGRQIVYVAGNHEFCKSEMKSNLTAGAEQADQAGIHLLHRRTVVIERVRFIGCTLWTDYRLLGTPKPSMVFAGQELNDHRLIRYRRRAVTIAASCLGMQQPSTGSTLHSFAASSGSCMMGRPLWSPTTPLIRNRSSQGTRAARCRRPLFRISAPQSRNTSPSSGSTAMITDPTTTKSGARGFSPTRLATPTYWLAKIGALIRAASSRCDCSNAPSAEPCGRCRFMSGAWGERQAFELPPPTTCVRGRMRIGRRKCTSVPFHEASDDRKDCAESHALPPAIMTAAGKAWKAD